MKLLLSVLLIVAAVTGDEENDWKEKQKAALAKCKSEHKVPEAELKRMNKNGPQSPEGKCYMGCLGQASGLIRSNGTFDSEKADAWVTRKIKDEGKLKEAKMGITTCKNEVNTSEVCETGGKLYMCLINKGVLSAVNDNKEWKDKQKAALAKCKSEHKVPQGELRSMNTKGPQSQAGKCYMGCIGQISGLITKDGKFDYDNAVAWINHKISDEEKLKKAKSGVDSCKTEVTSSNVCETGGKLYGCLLKKGVLTQVREDEENKKRQERKN